MREVIIKCDKCGEIINENPLKLRFVYEERNTSELELVRTINDHYELCEQCVASLIDVVSEFMVSEEQKCEEPEPVPEPEPEESPVPKYRGKIDTGRLRALYEAGWAVKEIAGEFGVSEQTVYNWLKQLKLR